MHLLQTYIPGRDYRVLYLDGEILVAYERIPPTITGDGENTIKNLIETNFPTINQKKVEHYLETQGVNTEAILGKNKALSLLPTANIAT
jgi:rimK-like ATP-grasp domain superfamily